MSDIEEDDDASSSSSDVFELKKLPTVADQLAWLIEAAEEQELTLNVNKVLTNNATNGVL